MADRRPEAPPPLASYVLRVRGQPARLSFELHDVRTGERRRFTRWASLAEFLRSQAVVRDDDPDPPAEGVG